ncbi:MAG: branched-chain amino acid ABC transporter permease [Syntrophales bacterium]|nr:branched-chain amino acid ABC transporter permease [Syntrophales bacterium]
MQILLNGLIQGLLTAVVAIGFAVVYNSTGIFHIAQGAVYALAPFLLAFFMQAGVPVIPAVLSAIASAIFLSIFIERFNHWPLHNREASLQIHLISSLGIYIAIIQIIALIWGYDARILRGGIDITYTFANLVITRSQAFGGIASIFLIGSFFVWMKKTDNGLKFMALADNPIQLSLLGYDIGKLRLLTFGLSGLATASAALLNAMDTGYDPHGGLSVVLLAMAATIVGGRGSFAGPIVAGILLAIIRSQVVWYSSARWQDTLTFLILVLFLFFRPQGILGKQGRIEST